MEQRVHSDPGADPRLIRISVGVEDLEVRSQQTCAAPAVPLSRSSPLTGPQGRPAQGFPGDREGDSGEAVAGGAVLGTCGAV